MEDELLTASAGESMKPKTKVTLKGSELDAVFARDVKMLEREVNGELDGEEDGVEDMDE